MSIGVLFLVQILFLILQVVLGVLSIKLSKPFLGYVSYFCTFIILYLFFVVILK